MIKESWIEFEIVIIFIPELLNKNELLIEK